MPITPQAIVDRATMEWNRDPDFQEHVAQAIARMRAASPELTIPDAPACFSMLLNGDRPLGGFLLELFLRSRSETEWQRERRLQQRSYGG